MTSARRGGLIALWLGLLAALALLVAARLQVSGDLRLFMPAAQTPEQRLLLDSLGEGPGARLLLVALGGAGPEALAEHSSALREALAERDEFRRVANGEDGAEAFDDALPAYRYLLAPTLDETPLDAEFLRAQLQARLQDLGSPAAALVELWIARDPTLETLRLAERWQPAQEPERLHGVWFTPDRRHALLAVETRAAGFDPQGQLAAQKALHAAFAGIREDAAVTLEASGPGAFSVLMRERTQGEAARLSTLATLAMIALLTLAYRSLRRPLLGALPLASAALAGLAAVSLAFGSIHGITLAFGFTLIGIALDYPVHLFSHLRPGQSPRGSMRAIWPTLLAGALSTCAAYASFYAAGVDGLRQLAVFTIAGLLTAAACTRWLLPALLTEPARDVADSRVLARVAAIVAGVPQRLALGAALLLGIAATLLLWRSEGAFWDDDLAHLTPVPPDLLQRDRELRRALGAPDVRHLLVIEAAGTQALLERSEALAAPLQALLEAGAIAGFELPSTYLPSARTQRARQARLPTPDALAAALADAQRGLPFREGVFAPFLGEVEWARTAPPLTPAAVADSPLGLRLAALLPDTRDATPVALVTLSGVADPTALAAFARAQGDDVHLLDLKAASESLAAAYRARMLVALGVAFALLALGVGLALRRPARVLRVLSPVLLASLLVVAGLHLAGVSFNLFHLIALVLAAGLGLDYALFFEHAGGDAREQRRTLHAIGVCAASTGLVFGLLATSTIPVLRAIGLTVALGVLAHFLLAALIARGDAKRASDVRP